MRADAIDLSVSAAHLRILNEAPEGTGFLRDVLTGHLTPEPAPIWFKVQAPRSGQRLHALLDRSGLVLARTRSLDDCLAILLRHLGALVEPPPDTVRLRMRAFVDEEQTHVVLAAPPLFQLPPMVERQVQRHGYRIVDRLAVDLTVDGRLALSASPWSIGDGTDVAGHLGALSERLPVRRLLVPAANDQTFTTAALVHAVAATSCGPSDHRSRLRLARRLADQCTGVPPSERSARYSALSR